jgi:hypothetical protein
MITKKAGIKRFAILPHHIFAAAVAVHQWQEFLEELIDRTVVRVLLFICISPEHLIAGIDQEGAKQVEYP